jgi:phosphoribosyl 1,2-cyclic phosphate phosphodiesterase
MKVTFLGTGAAEGVPAMFCNCQNCINIRKLGAAEFRTRTQVLVNDDLCVDFPPEAYAHSLAYGVNLSALKYLLVTHSHMDHFYAHDFILRGYKYATLAQDKLYIYGNEEITKVFSECTAREMKADVAPHLSVNKIAAYQSFKVGNYKVLTLPARHSKTEDALLYYVECEGKGYLHLYDTGRIDDAALKFLQSEGAKANIVAFDCTFLFNSSDENSRHMGIEDNMAIKQKLCEMGVIDEECKIVITHFSHNANPTRARLKLAEEKYGVIAAYDGMQIEV